MTEPTLRTSAEMLDRMEALIRRMASTTYTASFYVEAREIVAMLPEPVDPDIQLARDVAAQVCVDDGCNPDYCDFMRRGAYDGQREYLCALAGIKRGRELASA